MQSNAVSAEFFSRQLSPALRMVEDEVEGQPFSFIFTVRRRDVGSKSFGTTKKKLW